ncbi:unnamed protein product [Prorocentrum cordatum]|uniref:Uncharacterized protein n=1 Tax=Prorocentrum cordatum TaxID=2364126 RepID=A0ABN9RAZ9_9DINO|nr:unnamed protein product [Polarella glacialis]
MRAKLPDTRRAASAAATADSSCCSSGVTPCATTTTTASSAPSPASASRGIQTSGFAEATRRSPPSWRRLERRSSTHSRMNFERIAPTLGRPVCFSLAEKRPGSAQ